MTQEEKSFKNDTEKNSHEEKSQEKKVIGNKVTRSESHRK